MPPSHHDDPLSRTLAEWRVRPPANPLFRAAVWSRIEAASRPSTWTKFARAHSALVGSVFAAALLFGAWTGRLQGRHEATAVRNAIAAEYVHALDARWLRNP